MTKSAGEFKMNGDVHSRVKRRMLNDHKEDTHDDGLSLDLQLRPPSSAVEGPLNAVTPFTTLNGAGMVQHQLTLTSVNEEVNNGQRPAMNGVLELYGGLPPVTAPVVTAPTDPPPGAAGTRNAVVAEANGIVQRKPPLVDGGQRVAMYGVLGLMDGRPPHLKIATEARPRGRKRSPPQSDHPSQEKSPIIPPPYPWSTDRRAKVFSINTLLTRGITFISGEVQCRHCEQTSKMKFPLIEKFSQIWNFVYTNRVEMHERAPQRWLLPNYPTCSNCGHENSLKPIIADKKRNINWLFLLLGEMVGCCSLEQLKYFCKHTYNHRTGAKNRVLYLTYLTLCHQLNPDSPFRR